MKQMKKRLLALAALACLLFGGVLYLAALQAQGIHLI